MLYNNKIFEKYGVKNISQLDAIKKKKVNTFKKRFNATNNFGRKEILDKAIAHSQTNEAWEKRRKSLKKNGNDSSFEDLLENLLIERNIPYITNYKNELYPFHCDFYLPKYDMYIEINAHWTHNTHLFDKTNFIDLEILKAWKEKAKHSSFYNQAIYIWTELDIRKNECAKNNNLNFTILWNKDDIYNFINRFPIENI